MKRFFARVVSLAISIVFTMNTLAFGAERPTAEQFPDKTIIIGTHAIVLDALTEELLQASQESAKKSGQDKIYFKSDINQGTWYDISDSDKISEISTTRDNIVTNTTINEVSLEYYTKITGETIALSTGKVVDTSDFFDASDPTQMPEMEEVVKQKDVQNSLKENVSGDDKEKKEKKKVYESKLKSIERVLEKIEDTTVEAYNQKLANMETMVKSLQSSGQASSDQIALAVEQKMQLEQKRKAVCYQIEIDRLQEESKKLDYEKCSDLIATYGTAITNLQGALAETGVSNSSDESEESKSSKTQAPNSALDVVEHQYEKALEDAVENSNMVGMEEALEGLTVVKQVKSGDTNVSEEEQKKQLDLLQKAKLIAMNQVKESIASANQSEELKQAKADHSSGSTLEKIREDLAKQVASALQNVVEMDERILNGLDSPKEKEECLAKTEALFTESIQSIRSELKPALKEAISEKQKEIEEKRLEVKLSAHKEYQELKQKVEKSSKELEKQYEDYMSAVEKKEMQKADALKADIDKGAEEKQKVEQKMQEIEEGIKKGTISVDLSQGDDDSKESTEKEKEKEKTKEEEQKTEKETRTTGEDNKKAQEQKKDDSADISSATRKLVEVQEEKYTDNEKGALKQVTGDFLPPWYLVFQDYDVKLTTPIFVSGKEIYVPAEELGRMLGAQVIKSDTSHAVVIRGNGALIEYIPNRTEVFVNDKKINIKPSPSAMYGGRVYLPLSCFEKAFYLTSIKEEDYTIVQKK